MRALVVVFLTLVILLGMASSQQDREEVASPIEPANDTKVDNEVVPDAYAIDGQFERILVVRLKYETDILAGLEKIVGQQKVRNAAILSGAGSVRNYHFHVVSNRTFPSKTIFVKDTTSSADIVSINGYVIDGRVHAHISLANAERAFGGHLEAGTSVFTFAIVTLGVFKEGINLSRIDDKTYR